MTNPPNAGSAGAIPTANLNAGDLKTFAEYLRTLGDVRLETLSHDGVTAPVLVLPSGKILQSVKKHLDEFRARPERKQGTAALTSLDSFIAHANRFKDTQSAVFANDDRKAPSLTAVLDYHESGDGKPRFGRHRGFYAFPLSDEWKAWSEKNGAKLGQKNFAEFIEDRIADVMAPPPSVAERIGEEIPESASGGDFGTRTPDEQLAYLARLIGGNFAGPARLMELSRGLSIHANESIENAVTLATGETSLVYKADHVNGQGEKVRVPNLFLISIPVFLNGPRYRIAVRLRYRLAGGVVWFFELYRADKVFDHAFDEACAKVSAEIGLPLFRGAPEAEPGK